MSSDNNNNNNNDDEVIYVVTRKNLKEPLDTNQIVLRLQNLINRKQKINHVNPYELMLKVCEGISPGISTYKIDEYAANVAASLSISNPYYLQLAGRLAIDNHQKNTLRSFLDKMRMAYLHIDTETKGPAPMLNPVFFKFVEEHQDALEKMIDYSRDFNLTFFGLRTHQKSYSFIINDKPVERPQDTFLREAIAVNLTEANLSKLTSHDLLTEIKETYDQLSAGTYTHATPTISNSGGIREQLASCFLMGTNDSLEGIEKTGVDAAMISKWSGGIGIHVNSWRSTGSRIKGTNGKSSGIVPFLKIYDATMNAFNQGGRRPGSAKIFLMPHHPDFIKFLQLRRNDGAEKERARDLFYCMWIPDIFMERLETDEMWTFINPYVYDLSQLTGDAYKKKYLELESNFLKTMTGDDEKKYRMKTREIWSLALKVRNETGEMSICFADTCNRYSMQQNIGVIKSSNLCVEVILYSSDNEYATCVLASVALPKFVKDGYSDEELKQPEQERRILDHDYPKNPFFDYRGLLDLVEKVIVKNLNNVIDKTYSPCIEAERGNLRHRPIGIGVQGLDDAYAKMRYPFDSKEAMNLNKNIFECLYYGALTGSTHMCRKEYQKIRKECKENGKVVIKTYSPSDYEDHFITYTDVDNIPKNVAAYPSLYWNNGSPISKGIFHWELYGLKKEDLSGMFDWDSLKEHILIYGVKNSQLIALMPTATTSQLLGNNECFEPFTSNIYKRDTISGEFLVIKKYLIRDLHQLGIWNNNLKDYLILAEGSVQNIDGIPEEIKNLYKTAYEIDQKILVQQAIDRQPFVDQAQSLNLYSTTMTLTQWNKLMVQAWKGKLKTGIYYLHTAPQKMPLKFSIDPRKQKEMQEILDRNRAQIVSANVYKPLQNVCDACGS